jgi:hypothetical protein
MNKTSCHFDMKTPFDDLKYVFVSPKGEHHTGTFESAVPVEHRDYSGDIYEVRFYIHAYEKHLRLNKVIIYKEDDPILSRNFQEVVIGRGVVKGKPGERVTVQWHLQYVEDSTEIVFIQPI